ncbi:hypothetical protein NGTWS1803_04730 [Mycolicibacterium cyprinidarum]|nr:hypothetical protein NGTWS1803_04730 [Mycolicibacterium sp. NGTWS1803]
MIKNHIVAGTVVAGLSAAVLGLAAPAIAAPTEGDNAADTISALEAEGNKVVVNHESGAPLSEAHVLSVDTGPEILDWTWDRQRDRRILEPVGRVIIIDVR